MTPGLARGPPFPSEATKGSIVAIASVECPSVPRVVGVCEIDVSSLQQVQGAKGHAVRGYHWDGDELWGWGQSGKAGSDAPSRIEGWDPTDEVELPTMAVEALSIAEHDSDTGEGGVSLATEDHEISVEPISTKHEEAIDTGLDQEADVKERELSIQGEAYQSGICHRQR